MTSNLKRLLLAMAGLAGCLGGAPTSETSATPSSTPSAATSTTDPTTANATASGGTTQTFDHQDDDTTDPFAVLARIQEEGPPEFATRMHSCGKMKYATLGHVLADLGVAMTGNGATTPNGLYTSGAGAIGKPDYANRVPEGTGLSTAGAVRLYDIFVAAAPQIIDAMSTNERCKVAGTATAMFDTNGCTMAGIACLTGAPATQAQKDLCDSAVASNTTDMIGTGNTATSVGQIVAVASLLSAAHSCE